MNLYVFARDDTARRRKNSWKMGPFKSSGGREDTARLRVSGERGDDEEEEEERTAGKRRFFSLCESKRPFFFCRGKLERGERSTNAAKEYKSDVVVLTKAWTAQEGEKSRGRVRRN